MRTVRLTESDMVRLVKRIITEDVEMKQLSALSKSFPKVDSNELKEKWNKFKGALELCIGKKEADLMITGTGAAIPSCLLTIFGLVFSFGIIAGVSGFGCAAGLLASGKSAYDIAVCVKTKLDSMSNEGSRGISNGAMR
jgi:hypothetical protein